MSDPTWSQARRLQSWPPPSLSRAIADAGSAEASPTFVARQPIYDRAMEVYGYELLFRATNEDEAATIADLNEATASTIVTTFADIGLEALVGGRMCFVNVTREFILNDFVPLLPVGRVGLEISREVASDPNVALRLSELAEMGYIVVLHNFVMRPDSAPLLALAHMVKLDAHSFTDDQLRDQVRELSAHRVKLVAERIEDYAQFERCRAAGFEYFQGFFFCQPKTVTGKGIPSNRLAQVQLMAALQKPDVELEELDAVISRDLGVSYRLLRWINSAYFSLPRKVSSVHEALVLLGVRNVRSWAMLVTLAGLDDTPTELTRTAMLRAKMCELLAQALARPDTESYFTAGLFSVIDAFMNMRMVDVLAELPLAPGLHAALLEREGPLGEVLDWVTAYERGEFAALGEPVPSADRILRDAYVAALRYADETCGSVAPAGE
ncbi:MAG TPA: HDOD domain-containing protein [Gaiellales bacterium]|jgi:EAL and modified HD-GYP domain-containing signal transduction protein|nr:HDOD domain-containing protein [Gaiellales bacterium]